MIITLKKAILHIIAPGIDTSMYSQTQLDLSEGATGGFIISHLEKLYDDARLRKGVFSSNSGFKYHLGEYKQGKLDFVDLSKVIAEKLQEGIAQGEVSLASDIIICECIIHERTYIAILKCDNKSGISHKIVTDNDEVKNEIISFHAILPSAAQKLSECAFIELDSFAIRFKGKNVTVNGDRLNLMSEVLLECESEMSVSETYQKVQTIAKKISEEYGADTIETDARIKKVVKETPTDEKTVEVEKITQAVFGTAPAAKAEFEEKLKTAAVPAAIERVDYITKRANKKIKLLTDTEIELQLPSEYYRDGDNMEIIRNEDGTISIKLNNIREIINKSN